MISPGKSLFLQKVLESSFPGIFPTGGLAILVENAYFIKKVIHPGGIVEKAFFSGNAECNCQNVLLTLNRQKGDQR